MSSLTLSAAARRKLDVRAAEVKFAEENLKLPQMFEDSIKLEGIIARQLEAKSRLLGAVGEVNKRIEDREREILLATTEAWANDGITGGKPLSQAELDRRIKLAEATDEELLKQQAAVAGLKIELEAVELELRSFEAQHKGTLYRMKAAGAYMDFLRAGRDALTVAQMSGPYGV